MKSTRHPAEEQMELLVSKEVDRGYKFLQVTRRMKFFLILLISGILGLLVGAFLVLHTDDSAERIQEIGFDRVANSLENVLALMALPFLLFMALLVAYASQQVYKEYRSVNTPKKLGRLRKT